MPDYSNGKVYIIENTENDKIYIGSTTKNLKRRLQGHFYTSSANRQTSMRKPIQDIGKENFSILLLEDYPCNSKKELENIEDYWIGFFIEILGRDNVYNDKIDGVNSEIALDKMRNKLKQREIPNEIKQKISMSTRGGKNHNFNRGCISLKNDNNYRFTWSISENGKFRQKEKTFNFSKYGSEENALKEAENFRNIIYPNIIKQC